MGGKGVTFRAAPVVKVAAVPHARALVVRLLPTVAAVASARKPLLSPPPWPRARSNSPSS